MEVTSLALLRELRKMHEDGVLSDEELAASVNALTQPKRDWVAALGELASSLQKLAWPVLVVIVLIGFQDPLRQKLIQSQEVSIGSFSLKVKERAAQEGNWS